MLKEYLGDAFLSDLLNPTLCAYAEVQNLLIKEDTQLAVTTADYLMEVISE